MATDHLGLLARLATEYYVEKLSKVDIARRHDLSRFQVARLLDEAMAEGIVQISIVDPTDSGAHYKELARALGIKSVTVVPQREGESMRSALARHAADLIPKQLQEGSRLGVAWSRTLMHLPDHLNSLPSVDLVQLVGALSTPGSSSGASSALIHSLGALTGGEVWPLPTPLILDSAEVAAALRNTDEVSAALEAADDLDVAVIAIGGWGPGSSTFWGRMSDGEKQQAEQSQVVAECSGILLDIHGDIALSGMEERVLGVRPDQLQRAHAVAVAAAVDHPEAVIAACRAGIVDDLVLPAELARGVSDTLAELI